MRALTVQPGRAKSLRLQSITPPQPHPDKLLVRCLQIGICGTDLDIAEGEYGEAPDGQAELIIGHESLGEVIEAPLESGFHPGDLVVGFVRRPDPVPCANCAVGEWDMCVNDRYTERGIKAANGYAAEQFSLTPAYAIKLSPALRPVGILLEPTSVVAKAWEQILRIGARSAGHPRHVLVTGAGPIGLLAALIGRQRGFDVHVFDRAIDGPKPDLVRDLGAQYHTGDLAAVTPHPDIVIDCTGASAVIVDGFKLMAANGILCLAGLSSGEHLMDLDVAALGKRLVLGNDLIFGSVNANRRHYEAAAIALEKASQDWLGRLITRRVGLAHWQEAFTRRPDDIKVVIDFTIPRQDS